MVSPSKIFEKAKSELNAVIFPLLNKAPKKHRGSKIKSQRRTHSTLLESTRFYLDIRNKALLSKVESTLKSYGGKIELFFRKDIKIIVTDKPEWIGSGRSPSSSISPLTTASPYMLQEQRFAVPKSRASAMLEKVSQQPASPYCSPLELAQKWRIRILSVRNLWKWIAKVEEAYVAKIIEKKKEKALLENKVISPKNNTPFIKIESIDSSKTPEFLELESWPRLNLDGRLGQCPFRSPFLSNPIQSDNKPKEESNKLFEVKDKVAVELIQYNTDFKIRDSVKLGDWEAEVEQFDVSRIHSTNESGLSRKYLDKENIISFNCFSKMTRRPVKNNVINEEEPTSISDKRSISPFYNGHLGRNITRQSSQELLKVQCNGLTSIHRNSKLLSPSGSDVLPLPTSRRSTRRASASWCGSTRELSQLSPTDSEIENIRRSESSLETHDPVLDSPGITLRPKGQLWLPIALIGTTAEENGNCIRKRYDYSIKQSENAKLSSDMLDDKQMLESEIAEVVPQLSKEADPTLHSGLPQSEQQMKKILDRKDTYCIITRNTKIKNEEVNGRSRESSVESLKAYSELSKDRTVCKKRSFSVCGRASPTIKRIRTLSTNSVYSIGRKKKLSPEEKLLRDNKEYFKMEVLNTKLRSTGSLVNLDQNKEQETNMDNTNLVEKIDKIIIKKIKIGRKRRRRKWANANVKKGGEGNYTTVMVEKNKKHNLKINGVMRKKRQSELMKLCHEAENFMFGDCSRHNLSTNSVDNTVEESPRKKINLIFSNRAKESWAESNQKGNYGIKEGKARKKRRSHAEAFIHDNLDYYKFETPGSRLRYQGNLMDMKSEDKDFIYTLKQKKKERVLPKHNNILEENSFTNDANEESLKTERKKNSFIPSAEVEKILFSFESIPITEPWYEVYKRQDEGMENYFPLLSDPNDQPFLLPYEMPKPIYSKLPTVREYYKRRRKKLVHLFNHPRKSPRCHASTLAILSSLKKRKRRSGTNISVNSVLTISSMNNLNGSDMKSNSRDQDSAEKNEFVNEEILDFFYNDSDSEKDELLLEPFSDSESQSKRKNSDSSRSVKSDEEDVKNVKFFSKNKKLSKLADSKTDSDNSVEPSKHFLWQMINSESFSKDMLIETQKKSGLPYNIAAILENCKNCTSMEESDSDFISELYGGCSKESPDKIVRRRKKKARKINKTGWDNRKSRRRTGYKVAEVKDVECSEEKVKPNRAKTKLRIRETGINSDNIISDTKRKLRRRETGRKNMEDEDKPVLRSHPELSSRLASLRRSSQDRESISSSADSAVQDYARCVVRVKKIADSALDSGKTIKYSNRKYAIQKKSLILNRKKKRIIDYAWTTKKR